MPDAPTAGSKYPSTHAAAAAALLQHQLLLQHCCCVQRQRPYSRNCWWLAAAHKRCSTCELGMQKTLFCSLSGHAATKYLQHCQHQYLQLAGHLATTCAHILLLLPLLLQCLAFVSNVHPPETAGGLLLLIQDAQLVTLVRLGST